MGGTALHQIKTLKRGTGYFLKTGPLLLALKQQLAML